MKNTHIIIAIITLITFNLVAQDKNAISITIPDYQMEVSEGYLNGYNKLETLIIPFTGGDSNAVQADPTTVFGYIFGQQEFEGATQTKQFYLYTQSDCNFAPVYYIPNSLKNVTVTTSNILYGAFNNCLGLQSIVIGENVSAIGDWAFFHCKGLKNIEIGKNVSTIGRYVFGWCVGLTEINIPNSVTSIGNGAFGACTGLTTITIPENVTRLGCGAFSGCSELIDVMVLGHITAIENGTFYRCDKLKNVTIPKLVTTIGDWAFRGCSNLISINLNDAKSIGEWAFDGCTNLKNITIGENIVKFGEGAFFECASLRDVIINAKIPPAFGDRMFEHCTALKRIYVPQQSLNKYKLADGWTDHAEKIRPIEQ